ncbi:FUSC family protein [Dyella telluris]|uniref:FUSC family protein n=2 Tax=Dyella telluris TaxID=2763498 RepID=A0A7G8QA40_9GAMM|nr:FUSC family protein [Dyella telluris]
MLADLKTLLRGLWRDLATLLKPGPRLVDQAEAVASVLLAIALAQLAGTRNVGWAAFSGFMVIRSHLAASTQRAALRVLGTVAGALAGYLVAVRIVGHPWWACLALAVVVTGTMYMVLVGRRTYAWLFTGLTFLMVVVEGVVPQAASPASFALARVEEILIGTGASLLVSYLSSKTLRRWVPGQPPKAAVSNFGWYPDAAWHAVQAGLAAAVIPLFARWIAVPTLIQAGITVMAVMAIPLASLTPASKVVSTRMVYRFIGCGLGALLAIAILLVSHHSVVLITLGVCLGVAIGRHIENGPHRYGYIGVQFALAFLVVLVPDRYASANMEPGLERLLGILAGFAVLLLTQQLFRAWRLLLPRIK